MVRGHKRSIGAPLPELPPTEALILEAMAATMAGSEWKELYRPGEALLARWLSGSSLSALEAATAAASSGSVSTPSIQGAQLVSGKRSDSWRARYSFQGKTRTITGLASQAEAAAVRDAAFLLLHPVGHLGGDNVSCDNHSRSVTDAVAPTRTDGCDGILRRDAVHNNNTVSGIASPELHSPAALLGVLNSASNPFAPCFPLRLADFLVAVLKSCRSGSRLPQCAHSTILLNPCNSSTANVLRLESYALNDASLAQTCTPADVTALPPAPMTNTAAATPSLAVTYPENATTLLSSSSELACSTYSGVPLDGAPFPAPRGAIQASVSSSLANLVPRGSLPPSKRPLQYEAGVTHREWLALPHPARAPLHLFRTSGLSAACRDLGLACRPAQDSSMARRDVERRLRSRLAQIAASNILPSSNESTSATRSFASGTVNAYAPSYPDTSCTTLERNGGSAMEVASTKYDPLPITALRLGNEANVDKGVVAEDHSVYYGYDGLDNSKGMPMVGGATAATGAAAAAAGDDSTRPKSRRESTTQRPPAKRRKGMPKPRPDNTTCSTAARKEDAATAASLAADEADLLLQAEENLAAESLANMAAHGPSQGGIGSSSSSSSSYGNSSSGLISNDSHSYGSLSTGPGASIVGAGAAGTLAESAGDEVAASSSGYGFGAFDSLVTGAFLGFLFQVDGVHDQDHSDDDDDHRGAGDDRGDNGNDDDGQDAPYFINEPYDLAEGPWPGSNRL